MKQIAALVLLTVLVTLMLSPVTSAVNNDSGNLCLLADGPDPAPPFPNVTFLADGPDPAPPFPNLSVALA
jgi:hypothetical protein